MIERQFYQEHRHSTFYSLAELNVAFKQYLRRLNSAIMRDYEVSRAERFAHEKEFLQELPKTSFELKEWKTAKVHPDCHVQVQKNIYSVPWRYVKATVRARISTKLVEIFTDDGEPITAHIRLLGIGKFATQESHYPEENFCRKI